MRVRPRLVGRKQQGVELLLVQQAHENLPERLAAGQKLRVASLRAAPVGAGASAPSKRRALTGASFPDAGRFWIVNTSSPGLAPRDRYDASGTARPVPSAGGRRR